MLPGLKCYAGEIQNCLEIGGFNSRLTACMHMWAIAYILTCDTAKGTCKKSIGSTILNWFLELTWTLNNQIVKSIYSSSVHFCLAFTASPFGKFRQKWGTGVEIDYPMYNKTSPLDMHSLHEHYQIWQMRLYHGKYTLKWIDLINGRKWHIFQLFLGKASYTVHGPM